MQLAADLAGVDGQKLADVGLAGTDFYAFEQDAVGVGADFQVVADMHGGHEKAQLLCHFFADATNAA